MSPNLKQMHKLSLSTQQQQRVSAVERGCISWLRVLRVGTTVALFCLFCVGIVVVTRTHVGPPRNLPDADKQQFTYQFGFHCTGVNATQLEAQLSQVCLLCRSSPLSLSFFCIFLAYNYQLNRQ